MKDMTIGDKLFILGIIALSWVMTIVMKEITERDIEKRLNTQNYLLEEMLND